MIRAWSASPSIRGSSTVTDTAPAAPETGRQTKPPGHADNTPAPTVERHDTSTFVPSTSTTGCSNHCTSPSEPSFSEQATSDTTRPYNIKA